jgi:acyl-CoA reductase-like NAD-dependent aldehyde dehydrogenase
MQAPIIVFGDVDLQSAVNGTAFASFVASGQTCVSGTRIIIQDSIYDEFMAHFLEKTQSIRERMGNRAPLLVSIVSPQLTQHWSSTEPQIHNGNNHLPRAPPTNRRYDQAS